MVVVVGGHDFGLEGSVVRDPLLDVLHRSSISVGRPAVLNPGAGWSEEARGRRRSSGGVAPARWRKTPKTAIFRSLREPAS